jgi:hypothetical protein
MLESVNIRGRNIYPAVRLDKEKNIFELSGRSLPEDVDAFYIPIIDWVQKYIEQPNDYTEFVFRFDYYNSSTARKIIDILLLVEQISNNFPDKKVKIVWYYEEGDEVMRDNGEDFQNVIKIPFELKPLE